MLAPWSERLETVLIRWLGIRPSERRRTALLFSYLFVATLFVILGRTARDSLFLSRAPIDLLPWMYVGIAVATSIAASIYARLLSDRLRLYTLLQGSLVTVIWFLIGVRALIFLDFKPVYSILYIGMEVAGSLVVLQFWTFVNESFDAREAKRLFGVIGSGGILGAVCGGFAGSLLVRWLGVADLLMVCCCALVICSLLAMAAWRVARSEMEGAPFSRARPYRRGLLESLGHSRYTVLLATMAVLLTVSVSLVDYQFKFVAHSRFQEEELARLFGMLYGFCGLLSFVFHFFFTGRILMRVGLLIPLVTLPISLLLGAVTLIVWPLAFLPLVITKGADTTLRYSLYDSVVQLLYIPLPVPLRRRVKAAIDGVVKPVAIATTGLGLLMVAGGLSTQSLGAALLVLLGAWMFAALQVRQGYTRALMESVTQGLWLGAGDTGLNDVASVRALVEALRHGDEDTVCAALELLPSGDGAQWALHVLPLLGAPRPRVRMLALRFAEREGLSIATGRLEALLADPDEGVRASAVRWFGQRGGPEAAARLAALVRDPLPQVRATASVQLILREDEAAGRGRKALLVMSEAPDPVTRQWAAWGLGEGDVLEGEARLLALLDDPDAEVQRAAVEAAGKAQTPALMARLYELLDDRGAGADAALALANYGEEVLPSLLRGLERPGGSEIFRFHLLQALRAVGGLRVVEALIDRLPEDPDARFELLRAAYAVLRPQEEMTAQLALVRGPLLREVEECYQGWAILADLDDSEPWRLLRGCVADQIDRARQRVFLLIALAYPTRSVAFLYRALESEKRVLVANAIEVLEDILDRDIRPHVLGLLEVLPPSERVARARALFHLRRQAPEAWLATFLSQHGDRWLTICALHTIGAIGAVELVHRVRASLEGATDPVIRETALATLLALGQGDEAELCRQFTDDPQPLVRRLALTRLQAAGEA